MFSLTSAASGQRYAVKCFTRHVPDQEVRYQAISTRLAQLDPAELSQPWKLGFEYLPDAISVGQDRYPVLKMEWIDAVTLSSWLDDNHMDRFAVARLADRFEALTRDLSAHEIAHGDLQHGNLLVASDDTFRLVDYDGMYVPGLAGLGGTERGHRNYQSPMRGNDDFGATLDRFSTWVIFLSLKAVAADPALWNRLHEPKGESLLLTEDDFKSPASSTGLRTLLAHQDRTVSGLADQVRSLAFQPLVLLPPLTPAVLPKQRVSTTSTTPTSPTPTAVPGASGLPGWMAGHVSPQVTPLPVAPTTSPDGFRTRTLLDVVTAVLWPLALAAAVLLVVFGLPMPLIEGVAPIALAAAPIVLAAVATVFARSRRPERAQSREALATLTNELNRLENPVKAAEKLRKDQAKFDAAQADRNAAYPRAQDKLTAQYHGELKEAEKRKIRKQRDIDKKIDGLAEELRTALTKALADKRSAFVRDQLGRRLIAKSPPHGIGPKLVARLASMGVTTAADFTGYRPVQNSAYNNTGAVIVLSGGRFINVPGIGEAKARALDDWRKHVLASAVARQPAALDAGERRSIEQGNARRREQLTVQRKAVESEADAMREQARKRLEDNQARLALENTAAGDRARQQRQEFSRRTVALQQNSDLHGTLSAAVGDAKLRQRGLSYRRYLHFLCTGR
ncbi:hypothetical protein ACFZCG_31440 [Streptomyces tanashiensis]|uniref:hypothetical protein n=1 Tax=Streptomyces tanashiensis TaxID=67367 RepID=UPI0036F09F72